MIRHLTYRFILLSVSLALALFLGGSLAMARSSAQGTGGGQGDPPHENANVTLPRVPLSSMLSPGTRTMAAPDGPLAPLVIPCTRDCVSTCEVCVPFLGCAPEPICLANCLNQKAACWTLVDLYKTYMEWYIQKDVTYNGLSLQVKNALAPYIEMVDGTPRAALLDEITVGTSGTAGGDNAMTDCDRITWINSPDGNEIESALWGVHRDRGDIVSSDIYLGTELSQEFWVYHEFIHTFQCNELGGRTEYAYNWWSELPPALLDAHADPRQVHDNQPSEQNADARGNAILTRMPVIVPRYVNGIQRLGAQLTGTTVTFRASASNVMRPQTILGVRFEDETRFLIYDEAGNQIAEPTASPIFGDYTLYDDPVYTIEGDFGAQWVIPEAYQGQTLNYRFQILDNNGYLMDESSPQFLGVVKRYIYVDKDYAGGGSNGTAAKPYRTIGAALGDPDAGQASSIRIAPGSYAETPRIIVPLILEADRSGIVTIGR